MSKEKSLLVFNRVEDEVIRQICLIFYIKRQKLELGIKYLSFRCKPNSYGISGWEWLATKLEKK